MIRTQTPTWLSTQFYLADDGTITELRCLLHGMVASWPVGETNDEEIRKKADAHVLREQRKHEDFLPA